MEPFGARRTAAADDDAFGRAPVAVGNVAVHAVAKRPDADEIGVRIEDDDPERGLEEELLEDGAERVALPRAGLPAEERVPVEAARVEEEAHSVLVGELADVEAGPLGPRLFQPCRHARFVGPADRHIMERGDTAFEEHPLAVDGASLFRHELDGVHLPEVLTDRRVAPRLELEPVYRSVKAESAAVDRGRCPHGPILAHFHARSEWRLLKGADPEATANPTVVMKPASFPP